MTISLLIFIIVAFCFGNGQTETSSMSSPEDCSKNFKKWRVICTEDRKHCYDAKMQPQLENASKPTKRFSAEKREDAQCGLIISDWARQWKIGEQLGNGTFFEDFPFNHWINPEMCCREVGPKFETPTPTAIDHREDPLSLAELDSMENLTLREEHKFDLEAGWKLELQLFPSHIVCNDGTGSERCKTRKMWITIGCTEDGSECNEYWHKEIGLLEYEEDYDDIIDDQNPLPSECQIMGESDPKEKSAFFVICYESRLDPNNSFIERPEFLLPNINGNALASFCKEKANTSTIIWHGIAIKFWITLSNIDLLVDMQIHFSYTNKRFILPQIKKSHKWGNMTYEFMFNKKTKILDPYGTIHDDYPNENPEQTAGFWLAFLDMPTNISSILFFGETCSKIEASLNGNWSLLTAKCHQWKEELEESYRKMAEEQKKVKVILEQINELIRNCYLFTVDPNMPDIKPPPELIHPTDNYDGEQQLNQWGYYGDIIFGLEETQRILEQIREECGFGNMTTTENTVTIVQKFHSDFDLIEDEGDKNLGKAKIVDVHGDRIKKSPLDTDNENGENLLEGN